MNDLAFAQKHFATNTDELLVIGPGALRRTLYRTVRTPTTERAVRRLRATIETAAVAPDRADLLAITDLWLSGVEGNAILRPQGAPE